MRDYRALYQTFEYLDYISENKYKIFIFVF